MTAAANISISTPDDYASLIGALSHDRDSLARLVGIPKIRFARHVDCTTDDNTASASSPILNLTSLGVAFDSNMYSDVYVQVLAANGANRFSFLTRQRVLGGTNPTLVGSEDFLSDALAILSTALGSSGTTTTEDANCKAPGWWDGAAPAIGALSSGLQTAYMLGAASKPCRSILPLAGHFSHATSSIANTRHVGLHNPTVADASLAVAVADLATPSASSADGTLTVMARVLPPIECPVLVNTSPTPDEVFIGAKGLSSDLVTWSVDIYVTDQRRMPLL